MPSHHFTRLTLTGPSEKVARFVETCVRVRPEDEPGAAPSLDLDLIVPMPPEIRATLEGSTEELLAAAHAATGYRSWFDWISARWGTGSNVDDFKGRMIGDAIYDCGFTATGGCPVAAMRALAADYPELSGTVVAGGSDDDWSLVAAFRDGEFLVVEYPFDPRTQALAEAGRWLDPMILASARSLLSIVEEDGVFAGPDADERLWERAILATDHIDGILLESFVFKYVVDRACEIFEADGRQVLIDSDLASWPESIEHVRFLLDCDRARTEIDREMLITLAGGLFLEAMLVTRGIDRSCHGDGLWLEQLRLPDEDELRDWACLALFRPGAVFDFSDADALRASFLHYAAQLRLDIETHLRGQANVSELPAAA